MENLFSSPLLNDLQEDQEAFQAFLGVLEKKNFHSRDMIIDEKNVLPRLYFLVSGTVGIIKMSEQGQIVPIAKLKGDFAPFFGEGSLLGFLTVSANVMAETDCQCYVLKKDAFDQFAQKYPMAAMVVYRNLAQVLFKRLKSADHHLYIAGKK